MVKKNKTPVTGHIKEIFFSQSRLITGQIITLMTKCAVTVFYLCSVEWGNYAAGVVCTGNNTVAHIIFLSSVLKGSKFCIS